LCFDVSAVFFVGFGAEKRPRAEIFGTLRVAFSERGRLFCFASFRRFKPIVQNKR
jgi:hypothetical protein